MEDRDRPGDTVGAALVRRGPAPPPAGSRFHGEETCIPVVRAECPGPQVEAQAPVWPYPETGPHDGASVLAGGGETVHTHSGPAEDTG